MKFESHYFDTGEWHTGDCFDVMKHIPDQSIDMILCDLPYGTTALTWDTMLPFERMWRQYWRICRGPICLFGAEPFSSHLRLSSKFYKYDWYWKKNLPSGVSLAKTQPMRVVETISIFYKSFDTFNRELRRTSITDRTMIEGRKNGSGNNGSNHVAMKAVKNIQREMVNPINVLEIKCVPNAGGHKLHPTQKPTELIEYLIKTYSNPGAIILDNTAGSGTLAIAAINTDRAWVCIEKDETYAAKAIARIKQRERSVFSGGIS